MATHHTFVVSVECTDRDAWALKEYLLNLLNSPASPYKLAPCDWAPDQDTVVDALRCDYEQLKVHDLNPPHSDGGA